jgi:hypothetical protein
MTFLNVSLSNYARILKIEAAGATFIKEHSATNQKAVMLILLAVGILKSHVIL